VRNEAVGPGNEHDRGFHSFWTGVNSVGSNADSWGGGESIDQTLKKRLDLRIPYPTLNCGVQAADIGPKNGHRTSFSYVAAQRQVPTETDPVRLYAALFAGPDNTDPARAARRLRQRRSAMDYVAADLNALASRLGGPERQKLQAHETALREMENRLTAHITPPPGARCVIPTAAQRSLDPLAEANVPALLELMIDLVAQALLCNLTRVVTFTFGYCGNQWLCGWLGLNLDWHGEVAHKDNGADPVAADRMTMIVKWHSGYVARLARALAALPEGNGTALDNSLVVWSNENATGSHGLVNLPVVLVGRAGGRLAETGRVIDAGVVSNHRVATSVMRLMGVDVAGFGDRPDCGPVPGLG
jgi:hypothetical protein